MESSDITNVSRPYTNLPSAVENNVTSNTVTSSNDDLLWRLNEQKVILLLPVIIYVILSVLAGLVGNSFVCYIYACRLRRSPSRVFILFLAGLDLISCVVGAGSEITDLLQPYVFTTGWSCRLLRFGLSFTIISACFILICVAFDRYYKVCKPLNAFPVRKVKTLCIIVASMSFVLSSPALALFGLKTAETGVPGVTGTECSVADNMRGTPLPVAYYIVLFMVFIVLLACLILLYVRIGLEIFKRKRLTIGESLPNKHKDFKSESLDGAKYSRAASMVADDTSNPSCQTDDHSCSDSRGIDNPIEAETDSCLSTSTRNNVNAYTVTDVSAVLNSKNASQTVKLRRRRSQVGKMSIRTLRTTSIFFAVSAAFVLSFLPYLIANVLKFTKIAFYEIQSSSEEVGYNFCVRSYFISNFINPIIYSLLNINFRRECKKLIHRIVQRVKLWCLCNRE